MNASLAVVPQPSESLRPDISWIRKNVSVYEVAKALGMRIRGRRAKCWRPENHTRGDAEPSLHFYEKRNRVRCFVCDMRGGHSCIDLVMGILSVDVGSAVRWIAERFTVPNIKPGRPVGYRVVEPAPYLVGVHGSEFEVLVRSGMFGQLSSAESRILVTLAIFKDPESGVTRLSYQAIMRYSGVASRGNVARALAHLQKLHAIQISKGSRIGITRECSSYRVSLDDPKFYDLCNAVRNIAREEIAREREYRNELRTGRERLYRSVATKRKPTLNTTKAGGLRPPDPPHTPSFQSQENTKEQPSTCEGLNLSSPRELNSNKAVPGENREIGVSGEISGSEALRWRMLQRQAEEIKAKYAVQP